MSNRADVEGTIEKERVSSKRRGKMPAVTRKLSQVIEISSDEEDNSHLAAVTKYITTILATPKNRNIRYVHPQKPISISSSDSEDEEEGKDVKCEAVRNPLLNSPVKASHTREVIDLTVTSSDEADEAEEDEVLNELVKDSASQVSETEEVQVMPEPKPKRSNRTSPEADTPKDDPVLSRNKLKPPSNPPCKAVPSVTSISPPHVSDAEDVVVSRIADTTPAPLDDSSGKPPRNPDRRRIVQASPSPTSSVCEPEPEDIPKKASTSTVTTKKLRMTKKAKQAIEQSRREKYAKDLFEELNRDVFKGGLPKETQLKWSKRLLTTAGRARWKKSRDGSQTSEIELATKILDCNERIRNTLSHEMCHLACWIIDGDPKEGHGKAFKTWAGKVMRRRSDIEVTTRHNYEINYPYEWECENCAKIYGRYSKSIRPDECRCGACKVGVLVPLFKVRAPQNPQKMKADSQMAAIRARDLPQTVDTIGDALKTLTINKDNNASPLKTHTNPCCMAESDLHGFDNQRIGAQLAALTGELGGKGTLGE